MKSRSGLEKRENVRFVFLMRLGFPCDVCRLIASQRLCFQSRWFFGLQLVLSMMRRTEEVLSPAQEDYIPVAFSLTAIRSVSPNN